MEYIPFLVLAAIFIFREILHHGEILDLSAKIKASDLNEYLAVKTASKDSNNSSDSAPVQDATPFEDLDPQKALNALEQEYSEQGISEEDED